jgi:hypothetical protein
MVASLETIPSFLADNRNGKGGISLGSANDTLETAMNKIEQY